MNCEECGWPEEACCCEPAKPCSRAVSGSATCAWFDIRADNWRNFRNEPKCGKPASVTVRSVCGGIEMPLCTEHQAEYSGPDWIVTKLPNDKLSV